MRMRAERYNASSHLFIGGLFILIGFLFLLDTLDVIQTRDVISKGWPLILIGFGAYRYFHSDSNEARANGGIWMLAGFVFLLASLGYLHLNVWRLIGPLFLISIGVMLVMRSRQARMIPVETDSTINAIALLGGVERKITSQQFEGGELTAVMGGCNIDLRNASIKEAEAVLDVFVMWGGIVLLVPQAWSIVSKVMPIMGGFEDSTNPDKDYSKRLVIRGTILMGGIEVKNF